MRQAEFLRDGLQLSVAQSGEGPAIVFQHGLCGDARQTFDLFPQDFTGRRLTLECRGHGHSQFGPPEQVSIATFADDLISVVEGLKDACVVLGGISMGAAIALRIAVLRPDLVKALFLVRPAWLADPAPENMRPNAFVADLLDRWPPEEALRVFNASGLARELERDAPDNLSSLRGFFMRTPIEQTRLLLSKIAADGPDVDLSRVAAPTLVLGCARDHIHPLGMARDLAESLPNARFLEVAAKADHADRYRSDVRAAFAAFLSETN